MANRYPIILDTADGNKLKELPDGDGLDLDGNTISSVGNVTSTGTVTANSFSGTSAVVSTLNATSAITLNEFDLETALTEKANTSELGAVAFSNLYDDIDNRPVIPTDIGDLSDDGGLLSGASAFTDLSDTPDFYTGFSGKYVQVKVDETGLQFVDGAGAITGADVITALGYTPYDAVTNGSGFINSDTGIIAALGYTPYDDTNPAGYITGFSSSDIITVLGYTPYDAVTNTAGFLTGITGTQVNDALGYTPYDAVTNSAGFISAINSTDVTDALGFIPYDSSNPDNYITTSNITGTGDITFNQGTGVISFNNASGYLTAESDTLATVTGRGATTLLTITAGGFTTSGNISTNDITVGGNLVLSGTGTIALDGDASSTIAIGGTSALSLRSSGNIDVQASVIPNVSGTHDIGSSGSVFSNVHANVLNAGDIAFTASPATMTMTGNLEITPGAAISNIRLTRGVLGLSSITRTARNALSVLQPGYIVHNSTDNKYQVYVGTGATSNGPGWVDLWMGGPGAQPAVDLYEGKWALADGTSWDPNGNGSIRLMCYLRGGWVQIS